MSIRYFHPSSGPVITIIKTLNTYCTKFSIYHIKTPNSKVALLFLPNNATDQLLLDLILLIPQLSAIPLTVSSIKSQPAFVNVVAALISVVVFPVHPSDVSSPDRCASQKDLFTVP
jgi:hypothetical protein